MAPWLIALIFIGVLCGIGLLTDQRERRPRRGLDRLSTSTPGSDAGDRANRLRRQGVNEFTAYSTPPDGNWSGPGPM